MDTDQFGTTGINARARRKCLLGVTITLVEDSLSASEALRLMAVASGARLRRADRLLSAERHLALYRPNVVIVDLGLPDGSGMDLIGSIAAMASPRPGLIAFSGHDVEEWGDAALAAGADAILPKPVGSLGTFQNVVLSVLPDREERRMPVSTIGSMCHVLPPKVRRDDLAHGRELLLAARDEGQADGLIYAAQFVASLAVMIEDEALQVEAGRILARGDLSPPVQGAVDRLLGLLASRLDDEDRRLAHSQAG